MNRTTQHIAPNPALDFANAVLEETDGAREIIYMLHDIAQGVRENATTNDRIAEGLRNPHGQRTRQMPKAVTSRPQTNPETQARPPRLTPKSQR